VDKKRDFWKESVFHRRDFPAGVQKTYENAAMNWFNSCSLLQPESLATLASAELSCGSGSLLI